MHPISDARIVLLSSCSSYSDRKMINYGGGGGGEIRGLLLHGRPSYANCLSPNEINEINDSCKWSFTVPNFYVKFSTFPTSTERPSTPANTHITPLAFSLEKKSHFVSDSTRRIRTRPSFLPPPSLPPCNIEMLHGRIAAETVGRGGDFSRNAPNVNGLNRRKPYPSNVLPG